MPEFKKVAKVSDVPAGAGRVVEWDGQEVALFNVDGTLHAIENTCPHQGGPLGDGELTDRVVSCPWHGWQFDVATGECKFNPRAKVASFQVKVEGDDILVGR